jgi:hypothetical protein
MEYTNFIDLVAQAIEIDLANDYKDEDKKRNPNCENTLKNCYVWINLKGADMLCKTEIYHSWCKDIAKEVRILNGFIDSNTLTIVYHLIEMQSEKKYLELYGNS